MTEDYGTDLTDATVFDQDGEKVGSVGEVFSDESGNPAYVTVRTGWFGLRESTVPLEGAQIGGGEVRVPFTKRQIKDAPNVDSAGVLDGAGREELRGHYGLARGGVGGVGTEATGAATAGVAGVGAAAATNFGTEPVDGADATAFDQGVPDATATYGSQATAEEESRPWTDSTVSAEAREEATSATGNTWTADGGIGDADDRAVAATVEAREDAEWAAPLEEEPAHVRPDAGPHALNPIHPYQPAPGEHLEGGEPSLQSGDPHRGSSGSPDLSGYADDQPAAHAWAYEGGQTQATPGESPSGTESVDDAGVAAPTEDYAGTDYAATEDYAGTDDAATSDDGQALGQIDPEGTSGAQHLAAPGATGGDPQSEGDSGHAADSVWPAPAVADSEPEEWASTEGPWRPEGTGGAPEAMDSDVEAEMADGAPADPAPGYDDRDGLDMSDEERERLNQARGAL